ncbi:MAG: hypothetical protein U1F83_05235 [Verrucomicrobiota bacterium]
MPAWEVLPVVRCEIPVMVHADDLRQIRAAVAWAKTNNGEDDSGRRTGRLACGRSLLATNSVPVIFSHVYTQPQREEDGYDAQFRAAGVLIKAGVKLAFSGRGGRL